jgi:rhodanese-related sulfurtransferase
MKRILFFVAVFITVGLAQLRAQSQLLDVKAFDTRMASSKDKIVLDVRTNDEYNQGHLENAVMIDYYKPDFKQRLAKLDKAKPVFVYCAAGARSEGAAQALLDLGFKQVYDLQGGMNAWKKAKMPIVK